MLKKYLVMRITQRSGIHHNVVLNEGDAAGKLGLTMQLPEKTAWWHNPTDPESERTSLPPKVVPALLANLVSSAAEKFL